VGGKADAAAPGALREPKDNWEELAQEVEADLFAKNL